jgi:hypothetical protein
MSCFVNPQGRRKRHSSVALLGYDVPRDEDSVQRPQRALRHGNRRLAHRDNMNALGSL